MVLYILTHNSISTQSSQIVIEYCINITLSGSTKVYCTGYKTKDKDSRAGKVNLASGERQEEITADPPAPRSRPGPQLMGPSRPTCQI